MEYADGGKINNLFFKSFQKYFYLQSLKNLIYLIN